MPFYGGFVRNSDIGEFVVNVRFLACKRRSGRVRPEYPWRLFLRGHAHVWVETSEEANPTLRSSAEEPLTPDKIWLSGCRIIFTYKPPHISTNIVVASGGQGAVVFDPLEIDVDWRFGDDIPVLSNGKPMTENQLLGTLRPLTPLATAVGKGRQLTHYPSPFGCKTYGFVTSTQQLFERNRSHMMLDKATFKVMCNWGIGLKKMRFTQLSSGLLVPIQTRW